MDRRHDKKGGYGKKKWDGRKSSSYGKQPSSTPVAPGFPHEGTRMQTTQPDRGPHESHRPNNNFGGDQVEQLSEQFRNTGLEDHRFYHGPRTEAIACTKDERRFPRKSSGREQARGEIFSDASIPGRSHQGASNYPPRNYSGRLQTEKPKSTGRYTRGPKKSPEDYQVQTVRQHLVNGNKVLIMMRGCPGSGKSTLARQLRFSSGVILSTDDFFVSDDGRYLYRQERIGEAHEWNQKRALKRMRRGTSPIIIDNTNIQSWEMKPYVIGGIDHGYNVEIFEPNTSWKFSSDELARRNSHRVPKDRIQRMIDKYHHNVTVDEVLSSSNQPRARADQGTYPQGRW